MSSIVLRSAQPGDERALALVGQTTFLETFAEVLEGSDIVAHCARQHAPEVYRGWLHETDKQIWLAQTEGNQAPVGYVILAPADLPISDPQPDDLEVKRIYLLQRYQGNGTGRRLMEQAIAKARERGARRLLLGVYAGNDAAIAFYEHMGFCRVGERTFRVGETDCQDLVLGMNL